MMKGGHGQIISIGVHSAKRLLYRIMNTTHYCLFVSIGGHELQ